MLIINNYQFWTFVLLKTRASFACNFTFKTLAVKNTTEPSDLRLKGGLLGPIQIVIAQSLSLSSQLLWLQLDFEPTSLQLPHHGDDHFATAQVANSVTTKNCQMSIKVAQK